MIIVTCEMMHPEMHPGMSYTIAIMVLGWLDSFYILQCAYTEYTEGLVVRTAQLYCLASKNLNEAFSELYCPIQQNRLCHKY